MIDALIGQNLGEYEILERIGHGGMSAVFKARSGETHKIVALKILHSYHANDPNFLHRFTREARAMAQLDHPNIVRVFDFNTTGRTPYIAMEYVNGGTLKDKFKAAKRHGNTLPLHECVQIILQMADALAYAHKNDMVHRDIKPANILFDSETDRAILTDFGIVKTLNGSTQHTATGAMIGTPAYMSPEQGLGRPGDARSDIYALGVLFFQMVAGRLPYDADKPLAVVLKHINEPVPRPSVLNSKLPLAIEAIIVKAIAKDPEERFQTAQEIGNVLRRVIKESKADWARPIPSNFLVEKNAMPLSLNDEPSRSMPSAVSRLPQPGQITPVAPPPPAPRRTFKWTQFALASVSMVMAVLLVILSIAIMNPNSSMASGVRGNVGKLVPPGFSDLVDPAVTATPIPCDYNIRLVDTTTQGTFADIPIAGPFQMQWELRNDGNCPIPAGSTFAYEAGEPFGFSDHLTFERELRPAERIVMAATLRAPVIPGTFKSLWRIADPDDNTLGTGITFEVAIHEFPEPTPQPTAPPEIVVETIPVDFNYFVQSCSYDNDNWQCDIEITPEGEVEETYTITVFDFAEPTRYQFVRSRVHTVSNLRCEPWVKEIAVVGSDSGEIQSKNVFLDPTVAPISDLIDGVCSTP